MEDFKKEKPKYEVVRDSDTWPSPVVHDNAAEGIIESNIRTSTNDDHASSYNDDQEKGHYESARFDAESAEERSPEEP